VKIGEYRTRFSTAQAGNVLRASRGKRRFPNAPPTGLTSTRGGRSHPKKSDGTCPM